MHLFQVAFYTAGVYYALFIEQRLLIPFFAVIAIYLLLSAWLPGAQTLSTRKKIMQATWTPPTEPNIVARVQARTQKIEQLISSLPKENRPSITHFCIKALGQILVNQPFLNGSLGLGKFVPYDRVDVSCLVNVGEGKDLAMLCVKGVDKMSVEDIADFIKQKTSRMKKSGGGEEHKKQTGGFKLLPTFLVTIILDVISFISNKLGIAIPFMKIESHALGAGCLTSLGGMGFEDATAPFSGFTNVSILMAANAIGVQPVVEDGKVVVGRVIQCNFTVDHRYVDGANCSQLVRVFNEVFENPSKFMSAQMKKSE